MESPQVSPLPKHSRLERGWEESKMAALERGVAEARAAVNVAMRVRKCMMIGVDLCLSLDRCEGTGCTFGDGLCFIYMRVVVRRVATMGSKPLRSGSETKSASHCS